MAELTLREGRMKSQVAELTLRASEGDPVRAWLDYQTLYRGTKNTECSEETLACDLEHCDIAYGLYLEFLTWRRKNNGPFSLLIDENVSPKEGRALRNDLEWVRLRTTAWERVMKVMAA